MAADDNKLEYPKLEGIDELSDDVGSADDVLGRADALLSRHRKPSAAAADDASAANADFPVLTEVIEQPAAGQATAASTADTPTAAQDLLLDQMENELRLSLLGQMRPELERVIEMRVNERLATRFGDIMERMKNELTTELRRAVREALAQVVDEEVKRLKA